MPHTDTIRTDPSPPEKKYRPRLDRHNHALLFGDHARRVQVLQDWISPLTGRNVSLLPNDWRSWLEPYFRRTLRTCPHTQRQLVEVENEHGRWGMEICVNCGVVAAGPECPHVSLTWHADDTALICDNCGHDGT